MTIRWRITIFVLQLAAVFAGTKLIAGSWVSGSVWFTALVAIALNTQLLEPWFARPSDTLANSIVVLILFWVAPKSAAAPGWTILASGAVLAVALSAIALVFGAGRESGHKLVSLARIARMLCRVATARVIYTFAFWLDLLDFARPASTDFWSLGLIWVVVMLLASINWQSIWASATGAPLPCLVEGMIGPSKLLVAAVDVPHPGTQVRVTAGDLEAQGVVLSRMRRRGDVWAQIHITDGALCEALTAKSALVIHTRKDDHRLLLGVVEPGSTHESLVFVPTRPLEIGKVVAVLDGKREILYQLAAAEVQESHAKGGSHLVVRARADQLGTFDAAALSLRRHRWVPNPGSPVIAAEDAEPAGAASPPEHWLQLGKVTGTEIPVFIDCDAVCEGHLAVLGMTKMGKTTFALRLANALSTTHSVTMLDQTGEYVAKHGLPAYSGKADDDTMGITVFEPKPGETPADRALDYLRYLVDKAQKEYAAGAPFSRVLVIDEAHQFVPEPAGLGFGAPGRDSAYAFGLLMMQVRKYGISIILISQRTAVVAKSALSQCENLIAFKNVDQTGLEYLEAVLGTDVRAILPTLGQGEAMAFGPAVSSDGPVALTMNKPVATGGALVSA